MARIKLAVTQVKEVQKIGDKGAEKLAFKAIDSEHKELFYFTFAKSLFLAIKDNVGKEIEADVETTNREVNGNTYTDRKVTQIYVRGEAVATKGQPPKQGFQVYRDSPEARASIESQVAFKGVIDLLVAHIITRDDPFAKAGIAWALGKFGVKETQPLPKENKPITIPVAPALIPAESPKQSELPKEADMITEGQTQTIRDLADKSNIKDEVRAFMKSRYHKANTSLLTKAEASELIGLITKGEIKKIEKGGKK